jgi:hypothetical protein
MVDWCGATWIDAGGGRLKIGLKAAHWLKAERAGEWDSVGVVRKWVTL